MDEVKKYHISNVIAIILAIFALVADVFTIIPFVGDFVGPIFWLLASFYFWKNGMGFINGKRGITTVISTIAELIPGIQELPTIFVGMLIIIGTSRLEDKTGISVSAITSKKPGTGVKINVGGRREAPQKIPQNQSGLRPPNGGLDN